jgi:nucleoside-diphosphate-sugar epimerase
MVFYISSNDYLSLVTKTHSDIINPAVRGTTAVLNSVLKHGGSTVKRVVFTSSAVAVFEATGVPRVYTESDWNNHAVETVKTKGSEAGPFLIYCASKVLAERAAWDFVAAHKSEISWDLVALNPPWIFGVSFSFCS